MAAKKKPTPKKQAAQFGAERARQAMQARGYGLVRGLTLARLVNALEQFDLGYLRDAAQIWDKQKARDDTVLPVSMKRELDASLLDYEILPIDDSPEAAEDKAALEAAYNGLTATDALIQDKRGGVSTLIQQMMHCIGHRYAVHEIVWRPDRPELTADFRFIPLQYFEATTGRLRFLATEGATFGQDLEDGGWMVTVGPGLMEATSIAAIIKQLPLKAWLLFCDKAGMPGLHGETDAAFGSEEWDRFREALANFGEDWALVTSRNAKINSIDLKAGGQLPHPPLVERMDRAIARIWRGADLGTMSQKGDASGSNPQQSETDILAAADPLLISETLQYYFDRHVIAYRFGREPKAYFQLKAVKKIDHALELKIDDALIRWGVPRAKKDLLAKYGRPEPDAGEELATAPAAPAGTAMANAEAAVQAGTDAAYHAAAVVTVEPEHRELFAPILARLLEIERLAPEARRAALVTLRADLPGLAKPILAKVPALGATLARVIGPAFADGMTQAPTPSKP